MCYYFFCNCLDISKAFPITAGILLLPISETYFYIMLFGVYYIPYVSFCFLIIGLLIRLSQNIDTSLIKKVIRILLLTVSSFCAAANGLRLVLFVFIPLFCICALKLFMGIVSHDRQFVKSHNYYFIIYSALSLVFSIFGYGFNRLFLAKRFVYFSFGDLQLFNGHKIRNVLRAEFQALGYSYESPLIIIIFAADFAVFSVIVIIYICTKWKKLPYEHVLFAEYFSFSLLGVNLCFLLTNTTTISWYFIPALIMIIPLVTVFITDGGEHTVKYVLSTLLIMFTVLMGAYNYKHFNGIDFYYYRAFPSPERQVVARFLRNNRYTSGYGTVWNVGVWTELTNGQVEMWYAYELDEDMTQKWNIPEYLQSVDHIYRKPGGKKVFAVFDADEYDSAKSLPSEISEEVFRTNLFVVCDVIN